MPSAVVFCTSCGHEQTSGDEYCEGCGAALDSEEESQKSSWLIGSAPGCDLVVASESVSGQHCRLTALPNGFLLEDLGSTNGTYVSGQRIVAPTTVACGDIVTLGRAVSMPWPGLAGTERDRSVLGGAVRGIRIGREPDNDVVLDYPTISGYHARILIAEGKATLEDLGSTNGTAIGDPNNKIGRGALSASDVVYFGSFHIPAARLLQTRRTGQQPRASITMAGRPLVIGRDPGCDIALDFPMVSGRHAQLTPSGDGVIVEDLGSTNGTFVDGRRISSPVRAAAGDIIALGSYSFNCVTWQAARACLLQLQGLAAADRARMGGGCPGQGAPGLPLGQRQANVLQGSDGQQRREWMRCRAYAFRGLPC